MDRKHGHRRWVARILGWGLVAAAYAATLVWAGGLTADAAASASVTLAAAEAVVAGAEMPATGLETPAESPLVTLGIAAAMVSMAGIWYVAHAAVRPRRARRTRSLRLVVRHITTLM
jgi:hypothetical protein